MKCLPCLEHNLPEGTKRLKSTDVLLQVCDYMNLEITEVLKRSRKQHLVNVRMIATYLLRRDRYLNLSLKSIAFCIGMRDHSTIIHSIKKVEGEMEVYPEFRNLVYNIFLYVYGSDSYYPEHLKKKIKQVRKEAA